jgi:hypothetical protein
MAIFGEPLASKKYRHKDAELFEIYWLPRLSFRASTGFV